MAGMGQDLIDVAPTFIACEAEEGEPAGIQGNAVLVKTGSGYGKQLLTAAEHLDLCDDSLVSQSAFDTTATGIITGYSALSDEKKLAFRAAYKGLTETTRDSSSS